ncbi:PREDICTED: uncharacterized protein LOC106808215 [Priapulus caudatus]|uniref:Uncharacterized protein LOC106808215 n=1 Tax=Priapulus caudatus TaxID=37621 RepID=A0ABM1E293_PRICU|nr:PREDICTED: uncharacterized protein LOC106808215 [Priapulus caudatus]
MADLFGQIHATGVKSAILSVVEPYAEEYIPASVTTQYPTVLTELRDEGTFHLNYKDLLEKCADINIEVSSEEAERVEGATREQANSRMWFQFRSGRITASKMKAVCVTDPTNPSQSLIKSVCYPNSKPFTTAATKWGCEHEKLARGRFLQELSQFHENVTIADSGLVICSDHPYIAASPDGLVWCDCCGQSCLEIKCPYCIKDQTLGACSDPKFFLKPGPDGQVMLDAKHAHYYQIQTQMGAANLEACYFVVWTERDIHIERIMFDDCLWKEMCQKSKQIFQLAILPELVGKFYSRCSNTLTPLTSLPCDSSRVNRQASDDNTWCYCGQVESGRMIGCDNQNCKLGWFHYTCLQITSAPKGKWFCPDCRKTMALIKRKVTKPCP